jgi:hypothetical protein
MSESSAPKDIMFHVPKFRTLTRSIAPKPLADGKEDFTAAVETMDQLHRTQQFYTSAELAALPDYRSIESIQTHDGIILEINSQLQVIVDSNTAVINKDFLKDFESKEAPEKFEILKTIKADILEGLEERSPAIIKAYIYAYAELCIGILEPEISNDKSEKRNNGTVLRDLFKVISAAAEHFSSIDKPQETGDLLSKILDVGLEKVISQEQISVMTGAARITEVFGQWSADRLEANQSHTKFIQPIDRFTRVKAADYEPRAFRTTFGKLFTRNTKSQAEVETVKFIGEYHEKVDTNAKTAIAAFITEEAVFKYASDFANFGKGKREAIVAPNEAHLSVARDHLIKEAVRIFREAPDSLLEGDFALNLSRYAKSIQSNSLKQLFTDLSKKAAELKPVVETIRAEGNALQQILHEVTFARETTTAPYNRLFNLLKSLAIQVSNELAGNVTDKDAVHIAPGMYGMTETLEHRNRKLGTTRTDDTISLIIKDRLSGAVFLYNCNESTTPDHVIGAVNDFLKRKKIEDQPRTIENFDVAIIGGCISANDAYGLYKRWKEAPENTEKKDPLFELEYYPLTKGGLTYHEMMQGGAMVRAAHAAIKGIAECGFILTHNQIFDSKIPASFTIDNNEGSLQVNFGTIAGTKPEYCAAKIRMDDDSIALGAPKVLTVDMSAYLSEIAKAGHATTLAYDSIHGTSNPSHSPYLVTREQMASCVVDATDGTPPIIAYIMQLQYPKVSGLDILLHMAGSDALLEMSKADALKVAKKVTSSDATKIAELVFDCALPLVIGIDINSVAGKQIYGDLAAVHSKPTEGRQFMKLERSNNGTNMVTCRKEVAHAVNEACLAKHTALYSADRASLVSKAVGEGIK